MSKARLLVPAFVLLIVSAFALAACGSSESDEDKIVNTIETAATSINPTVCEETQTVAFMEQSGEGEGKEAVEDCEKETEAGQNNPESVEVTEVAVEGSKASADVSFTGSPFDGQTLAVNLIEEEGDWKLNEAESFVNLNRGKLIASLEKGFEEAEEKIEPAMAECIIEGIEESSDSELEDVVLHEPKGFEEIAEKCSE